MRIVLFVLLILIVAGVVFCGNYYIVSGKGHTVLIPKASFAVTPVYVDVDKWTVLDLVSHREVAMQIVRAGRSDLLPGSEMVDTINTFGNKAAEKAKDALEKGKDAMKRFGDQVRDAVK